MELLDHGLAVGTDLIGHIVEIHGIKGVKIGFETCGITGFFRWFTRFVFLPAIMPGNLCQG